MKQKRSIGPLLGGLFMLAITMFLAIALPIDKDIIWHTAQKTTYIIIVGMGLWAVVICFIAYWTEDKE